MEAPRSSVARDPSGAPALGSMSPPLSPLAAGVADAFIENSSSSSWLGDSSSSSCGREGFSASEAAEVCLRGSTETDFITARCAESLEATHLSKILGSRRPEDALHKEGSEEAEERHDAEAGEQPRGDTLSASSLRKIDLATRLADLRKALEGEALDMRLFSFSSIAETLRELERGSESDENSEDSEEDAGEDEEEEGSRGHEGLEAREEASEEGEESEAGGEQSDSEDDSAAAPKGLPVCMATEAREDAGAASAARKESSFTDACGTPSSSFSSSCASVSNSPSRLPRQMPGFLRPLDLSQKALAGSLSRMSTMTEVLPASAARKVSDADSGVSGAQTARSATAALESPRESEAECLSSRPEGLSPLVSSASRCEAECDEGWLPAASHADSSCTSPPDSPAASSVPVPSRGRGPLRASPVSSASVSTSSPSSASPCCSPLSSAFPMSPARLPRPSSGSDSASSSSASAAAVGSFAEPLAAPPRAAFPASARFSPLRSVSSSGERADADGGTPDSASPATESLVEAADKQLPLEAASFADEDSRESLGAAPMRFAPRSVLEADEPAPACGERRLPPPERAKAADREAELSSEQESDSANAQDSSVGSESPDCHRECAEVAPREQGADSECSRPRREGASVTLLPQFERNCSPAEKTEESGATEAAHEALAKPGRGRALPEGAEAGGDPPGEQRAEGEEGKGDTWNREGDAQTSGSFADVWQEWMVASRLVFGARRIAVYKKRLAFQSPAPSPSPSSRNSPASHASSLGGHGHADAPEASALEESPAEAGEGEKSRRVSQGGKDSPECGARERSEGDAGATHEAPEEKVEGEDGRESSGVRKTVISYRNFKRLKEKVPPSFAWFFTPATYAHLLRDLGGHIDCQLVVRTLLSAAFNQFVRRKCDAFVEPASRKLTRESFKRMLTSWSHDPTHIALAALKLQDEESQPGLLEFFVSYITERMFFFLDADRAGRIRVADLLNLSEFEKFMDIVYRPLGADFPECPQQLQPQFAFDIFCFLREENAILSEGVLASLFEALRVHICPQTYHLSPTVLHRLFASSRTHLRYHSLPPSSSCSSTAPTSFLIDSKQSSSASGGGSSPCSLPASAGGDLDKALEDAESRAETPPISRSVSPAEKLEKESLPAMKRETRFRSRQTLVPVLVSFGASIEARRRAQTAKRREHGSTCGYNSNEEEREELFRFLFALEICSSVWTEDPANVRALPASAITAALSYVWDLLDLDGEGRVGVEEIQALWKGVCLELRTTGLFPFIDELPEGSVELELLDRVRPAGKAFVTKEEFLQSHVESRVFAMYLLSPTFFSLFEQRERIPGAPLLPGRVFAPL
ncbi:hypothetical protein BESB_053990 [Besnoitia besnoiti]|uniref:EF-hand domain-containing protein n=1 Tax=Besnoitia besnoiti TaxID=94643 RepID=A0A2A9MB77_BESBE|nr:hypothetical protein BESB_053990 [Besnoitia besnoiti]PFH35748.1 hypothetical protein BESB_053990 [Besnoitia besnoiti]